MSEPALRLLEDDGTPEEITRLREIIADLQRQVASLKRMLQAAHDEIEHEREAARKFGSENASLKRRLLKQHRQAVQDELFSAIFEFWKLMLHHPRAEPGEDRVNAVNARLRGGKTPRDFFKAIVGAAYDAYVDDKGKRHDDLELICRGSKRFEDFARRYYDVPDVMAMVVDAGAVDAARALMDLERARKPDA